MLPNNYQAASDAATLLINRGFKNFAYLAGEMNSSTNMERQLGFLKKLSQEGYSDVTVGHSSFTYEAGMKAMRALAPRLKLPCGILCANDLMAFGAMDVLKYERGLKIGTDVALIGFDNLFMGEWPAYSLTSFAQPIKQMVQDGVKLLFDNIADKNMTPIERRYPLTLIERDSTAPQSKANS